MVFKVFDEETGCIKWVPTNVNIDNHVIVPKLDPNIMFPDKFVDDYISNLSKSSIDNSKPLWDLHLLDIKTTEDEGTGVFLFWNSTVAVVMFVLTFLFLKDTETPLKGTMGVENRPRRFLRKSVSLADVKVVKDAMNVVS
ncbi:hypothetical protein L1987_31209 [Smallanthus sonchifolius]|uniref:Uncharacterized protein n=1 Tax=Smallanthus sonchifolius TaxID=185202 RepID=A0ACB9I5N2_9ASTR|nr:hypothetical protein L1987_31209 [Smallanthus sonchifolius]